MHRSRNIFRAKASDKYCERQERGNLIFRRNEKMKMTAIKKVLSLILSIVLIAAMALLASGCNGNNENIGGTPSENSAAVESTEIGVGAKQFTFTVIDLEGRQTVFLVKTDKETVGEALLENNLIAGEQGDFGLYVKTVNGITVDYDIHKKYWAFYEGDKYAAKGVDQTPITEGAAYSFRAE